MFFGPCLLCTSGIWTFGPPERELAYMLADQGTLFSILNSKLTLIGTHVLGYDIWLGNTRGTTWSKDHESLSSDDPEYWAFEWETAALHDYPAELDYVLGTTGADDLFFVGYSQGTTQYFVLLSEMPEYNDIIRAGFMLAPPIFMGDVDQPASVVKPEMLHELAQVAHEVTGRKKIK